MNGHRPRRVTAKGILALLVVMGCAAGCTRAASTVVVTLPAPPGAADWSVRIERVEVQAGQSIEVDGTAVLPPEGCLRTALLEAGEPVPWWPEETCVTPDPAGQWQMVVPLGRAGAPETLDRDGAWAVRAWWPEREQEVTTEFPFDLQGPPSP